MTEREDGREVEEGEAVDRREERHKETLSSIWELAAPPTQTDAYPQPLRRHEAEATVSSG